VLARPTIIEAGTLHVNAIEGTAVSLVNMGTLWVISEELCRFSRRSRRKLGLRKRRCDKRCLFAKWVVESQSMLLLAVSSCA
jgi:hypothetical protein